MQREAARWVTSDYSWLSSVTAILSNLNWPTLAFHRKISKLHTFYKAIHNLTVLPIPVISSMSLHLHIRNYHSLHYHISGIVCKRKLSRYVNCHSIREKTLANLVILLKLLVINKKQCKKIFANVPRLMKSRNIFFRERFPIYIWYIIPHTNSDSYKFSFFHQPYELGTTYNLH